MKGPQLWQKWMGVQGREKSSVVKRLWRMQEWKRSVRVSGVIEVCGEHKCTVVDVREDRS